MTSTDHSPARTGRVLAHELLTRDAIVRLVLGWAAVGALSLAAPLVAAPLPSPVLALVLPTIVAVIVVAAGGVVHQAEALARRLGDPYGTLVLTLSIVVIEVVLIAAVMLGPGEHTVIARDSVMAVSMIIMNLALGLCLLAGGLRHGSLAPHRVGTSAYLVMLVALAALTFALPATIGEGGSYAPGQALVIGGLTMAVYAFFHWRQLGAQAGEFQELGRAVGSAAPPAPAPAPGARVRAQPAGCSRPPTQEVDQLVIAGAGSTTRARHPSWVATQFAPSRPPTTRAVDRISARPACGATTVADRAPAAGRPVAGSTMWSPRSYAPDVAIAPSNTSSTPITASGSSGWRTPIRHGWPGAGQPRVTMSPPAFTARAGKPRSTSRSATSAVAQPLT